ncbi:hypothetical protein [Streptomyces sp. NBC_01363]|uniref:hypothetical protein n=1 Tax=Streptomyces sp. NBC_01363 TaxID=2903840 RepID=UPI00224E03BC|nr:hypothetical protein [Streptomyces sp. NBC_01363]MCX4732456.1 hypothetical protein [Streptomyces sp. NBC_01363]
MEALGESGRLRHRIEHIETVPNGLAARFADPVAAPADELGEAPVRLTVCGGRVVHRG